jgi:hypothetical protein
VEINEQAFESIDNPKAELDAIHGIIEKHANSTGLDNIPVVFMAIEYDKDAFAQTTSGLTKINGHQVVVEGTWSNPYEPWYSSSENVEQRIEREIRADDGDEYVYEQYAYLKGVNFAFCTDTEGPVYSADILKGCGTMPSFDDYEEMSGYIRELKNSTEEVTGVLEVFHYPGGSNTSSYLGMGDATLSEGYISVRVKKDVTDAELDAMYDVIEQHTGIEDVPVAFSLEMDDKIDRYFEETTGVDTGQDVENVGEVHNTAPGLTLLSALMLIVVTYVLKKKT